MRISFDEPATSWTDWIVPTRRSTEARVANGISGLMSAGFIGRDHQRSLLEVFFDDEIEKELAHAVGAALAEDPRHLVRLQLDSRHRLQVLAEDDGARAERDDEDDQQHRREGEQHPR